MQRFFSSVDWILLGAVVPIVCFGIITMNSFVGDNYFAERQIIWAALSFALCVAASSVDWRFLRQSGFLVSLFGVVSFFLVLLFGVGQIAKGAQSWFSLGLFSVQPADFMKIVVVMILAKYFSRRHIEIAHVRHVIVSALYAGVPALLVLVQPDFGSAVVIGLVWFGMILVSGVSKKHLVGLLFMGVAAFTLLWFFVFQPYQQARILTFLNPTADIHGAGYNAFQSQVAVGSGQMFGKGIGYGTQSRLSFLPEYETDFIFAAFAEEWGFFGVILLFILYAIIMYRILLHASRGATNFEVLYGVGIAILISIHFVVNVGMNIGLLPVTGIPLPFMSYGGSHLVSTLVALGILMGMSRYGGAAHRDAMKNEFLGIA